MPRSAWPKPRSFPAFKLTGGGGLDSVNSSTFLEWENRALSIGPGVTFHLPRWSSEGRPSAPQRAATKKAPLSIRQTLLIALREVEDAMLN